MNETIFTEDELNLLFPNQIQREIFINGMEKLIKIISERTVHAPFVMLEVQ